VLTAELQAVFPEQLLLQLPRMFPPEVVAASRPGREPTVLPGSRPQAFPRSVNCATLQGKTRKGFCTCSMASNGRTRRRETGYLHETSRAASVQTYLRPATSPTIPYYSRTAQYLTVLDRSVVSRTHRSAGRSTSRKGTFHCVEAANPEPSSSPMTLCYCRQSQGI